MPTSVVMITNHCCCLFFRRFYSGKPHVTLLLLFLFSGAVRTSTATGTGWSRRSCWDLREAELTSPLQISPSPLPELRLSPSACPGWIWVQLYSNLWNSCFNTTNFYSNIRKSCFSSVHQIGKIVLCFMYNIFNDLYFMFGIMKCFLNLLDF